MKSTNFMDPNMTIDAAHDYASRLVELESLFARMRGAYLDLCQRQITKLQHELAVEKATTDADLGDLLAEADRLAAKVKAAKEALK